MDLYHSAAAAPIAALHADEIAGFAAPGDWLSGEERSAVVRHARGVRAARGLQPASDDAAAPEPRALLPEALLELVEKLALAPRGFTSADHAAARTAGVGEGEYVEAVGLVARSVNVDLFARGCGAQPPALAAPVDGEPALERPPGATAEGAWVATLPADGSAGARAVYGGPGPMPFIYRALSLAPREARQVIAGGNLQYLTLDHFMDFDYSAFAALSRPQVEVVAGRISARNDCFY